MNRLAAGGWRLAVCAAVLDGAAAAGESAWAPDAMRIPLRSEPTALTDQMTWALAGLVLILGLFGLTQSILRRRDLKAARQKSLARAAEQLRRKAVDAHAARAIMELLRRRIDRDAENPVVIAESFDRLLAGPLEKAVGGAATAAARQALFQPRPEGDLRRRPTATAEPEAARPAETHPWLAPGGSVRLKVAGEPARAGVVIRVAPEELDLALPPGTRLPNGAEAEVELDLGKTLCRIKGVVKDMAPGAAPLARLGGFFQATLVSARAHARIRVDKAVRFGHCPGAEAGGGITLAQIQERLRPELRGYLWDISLGGCCLVSAEPIEFLPGDFVQFSLPMPPPTDSIQLIGAIVSVSPEEARRKGMWLHVQYLPLDDSTGRALMDMMRHWSVTDSV